MSRKISAADQTHGHQSAIADTLFLQRGKGINEKLQVRAFPIFAGPVFKSRISGRSLRIAHSEFLSSRPSENCLNEWFFDPWKILSTIIEAAAPF
jgi:hypothetical protein